MANNFQASSLSDRFNGLGSALVNFFKSGGSNFSQSVMPGLPVAQVDPSGKTVAPAASPSADVQAEMDLTVQTKSGVKVKLTLENQAGGLAVKVTSSAPLSDTDRSALEKLSGAFQDAVDGLAADPPHLDLGGLTQYDPAVLSSVDLHSNVISGTVTTQTLDFHADSKVRTVSSTGPAGNLKISVDMSNAASWGSQQQRTSAINSYLKQFDQATARGKGDAALMGMFKDAFTQMNSNYGAATLPRALAPLNDSDHAMLSGLADFSASVTQTPQASNPMHLNELDTFAYQVSQNTNLNGASDLERSFSQTQQSHLTASYHTALDPDSRLKLTTLRASQNYYFEQIDDAASSATAVAYHKGALSKASSSQSASQSTHLSKYEDGNLTEDTTTPWNTSKVTDLLALLKPLFENSRPESQSAILQQQQTLSKIHDLILLQTDPASLHGNAAAS